MFASSSSPVSTANTPTASPNPLPRIALVPSEAALLHSLLRENNIMPPMSNNSMGNSNTIDGDFCLFDDESSFDSPLFAARVQGIKLLQQQHQLQQLQDQHLFAQQQQQYVHQQHVQHHHVLNTNPLCTPQTPSLDFPDSNYSRPVESLGFDSFSSFVEESAANQSAASALAVAFIHLNDATVSLMTPHQHPLGHPSLVSAPCSPYLGTPYETPFLGDFGLENERMSENHLLFDASGHASGSSYGDNHSHSHDIVAFPSLFPDFDFEMPSSAVGCALESSGPFNNNTIEPATLLMDSPALQQHLDYHLYKQEEVEEDESLSFSSSSSSLSSDFDSCISASASDTSSPSSSASPLVSHIKADSEDPFDFEEPDEQFGDEDDDGLDSLSSSNSDDDKDDHDFIPSRPSAANAPMSGFKRKALDSFNLGEASGNMANDASASTFKRTRPELASPFGGKKRSGKSPKTTKKPASGLSKAKRFSCIYPSCERRFTRLFNLHTHEKTHDPYQLRPFICPFDHCRKAFSRKHDLQRHQASVHMGERNYRCETCRKPFSRQDGLRRHLVVNADTCGTPFDGPVKQKNDAGWIAS